MFKLNANNQELKNIKARDLAKVVFSLLIELNNKLKGNINYRETPTIGKVHNLVYFINLYHIGKFGKPIFKEGMFITNKGICIPSLNDLFDELQNTSTKDKFERLLIGKRAIDNIVTNKKQYELIVETINLLNKYSYIGLEEKIYHDEFVSANKPYEGMVRLDVEEIYKVYNKLVLD